jgi:hypothetical protein
MGLTSSGNWMRVLLAVAAVLASGYGASDVKAVRKVLCYHSRSGNRTIYDYKIQDVHGEKPIDWSKYRGNVVLLVNVASF